MVVAGIEDFVTADIASVIFAAQRRPLPRGHWNHRFGPRCMRQCSGMNEPLDEYANGAPIPRLQKTTFKLQLRQPRVQRQVTG